MSTKFHTLFLSKNVVLNVNVITCSKVKMCVNYSNDKLLSHGGIIRTHRS